MSAQSDNRGAYKQLRSWARDEAFPFHEIAQQSADSIQRDAENTMFGQTIKWDKFKLDPSKLRLPELERLYKDFDERNGVDTPQVKVALIQYIAGRADFNETDRLRF